MTLRELLAELRGPILRDQSSAVDATASEGALFSDTALINYINEAQNLFCRKTNILRDSRTAGITQITMVAGQQDYPISPKICTILRARFDGRVDLGRVNSDALEGGHPNISPDPSRVVMSGEGEPSAYYTDSDTNFLGVSPIPSVKEAGKVLSLRVSRLALLALVRADLENSPEIPEDYHLSLLDWAAYRALSNQDTDFNGDPANISIVLSRNNGFKNRFEAAITQAKTDVKKLSTQNVRWKSGMNWS